MDSASRIGEPGTSDHQHREREEKNKMANSSFNKYTLKPETGAKTYLLEQVDKSTESFRPDYLLDS